MDKLKIIFVSMFLILHAGFISGQEKTTVDSLFVMGVEFYQNRNYQEALDMFEYLDNLVPEHERTTASLLMQGKSLYNLEMYEQALEVYTKLIRVYPESRYADHARYGMAQTYYKTKKITEAVQLLLHQVEKSRNPALQRKSAKLSSDIMDFITTRVQLFNILENVHTEKSKAAVTLKLARLEIKNSNYQSAKTVLDRYLTAYPISTYDETMRTLLAHTEELGRGVYQIGVILPLTGINAQSGQAMLDGILFAVDEFNEHPDSRVQLIVKDSGSDIVKAIKAAQELCANSEIIAIIGELESSVTAAIAAVAQEKGVVLAAPTANADGIAGIGSFIFQLNPSLGEQARYMASYGVESLGLRRLAVLYPATLSGKTLRDAFVAEAERLGAEIVDEKYYHQTEENWQNHIGNQLRTMREGRIQIMLDDSVLFQVEDRQTADELNIDGLDLYVNQSLADLVDSTALAVNNLDGIFVPILGGEMPFISSQLAKWNLGAQILGGPNWNDSELLEEHSEDINNINGIVFPSASFTDVSDNNYYLFRDRFRQKTGRTPDMMEIFSYDCIRVLLSLTHGNTFTREQFRNALIDQKRFHAIKGPISLDEYGQNTYLHLLRYFRGRMMKIR